MAATVLVVDDESPIVEIIQDSLERRGYRVLATTDSARVLAMVDEDLGPIHRWPEVQVIFMSGHTRESLPSLAGCRSHRARPGRNC